MTELIIKMVFWLVTAMSLGFVIAWFLSKTIYTKKHVAESKRLKDIVTERNNAIVNVEKNLQLEKSISGELLKKLEVTQSELKENKKLLENANTNANENLLLMQIKKLKEKDSKRENELKDFEAILLLAEEKIAENEKNHKSRVKALEDEISALKLVTKIDKKSIKSYLQQIDELKEETILYQADTSRAEFIMTREQFLQIEEQLRNYEKELQFYKNENNNLIQKIEKTSNMIEAQRNNPKELNSLLKESDDGAIVKSFRETYKKITSA